MSQAALVERSTDSSSLVVVRLLRRLDVGPRTVEGAAAASLAGIAIVAGNTVVVEPQIMVEAADAAGLFIHGLPA